MDSDALRAELLQQLLSRGEELARALFDKALEGDLKALGMIRELTGESGETSRELPGDLSAFSDAELMAERQRLLSEGG